MAKQKLLRVLGLKESISMTIGTVVGVGLFTCGSSQIGLVGAWIIGFTFVALLISIWPCLIYGEMSAALPQAGGTYNFAKRGLNPEKTHQSPILRKLIVSRISFSMKFSSHPAISLFLPIGIFFSFLLSTAVTIFVIIE